MWRTRTIDAAGVRFFLRECGEGPDVVLALHGWPQTSLAWRRVGPLLAAAGWRVVCPDLKGFGRSDRPRRGYDPATLAAEQAALIAQLTDRPAVVVGHDWGGAVAFATARRHPDHVRALVVIDSPYRRLSLRHAWHIPLLNVPGLAEAATALAPEVVVRAVVRYAAVVREAFDDEVIAEYAASLRRRPPTWLAYYRTLSRRAVLGGRRHAPAAPLGVPVRLVWGIHDPVLPVALAEQDAADLGAELVRLPVGHFPPEEDPRAVAAAIIDASP